MRRILLIIAIVALVGGTAIAIYASPQPRSGVVDTWVIGDPVSCVQLGGSSAAQCQALINHALPTIATPTGATITGETLHALGDHIVNGERVQVGFGQPHSVLGIFVVQFSNGVSHAAMFGCAGTSQRGQAPDPLCPGGGVPFP